MLFRHKISLDCEFIISLITFLFVSYQDSEWQDITDSFISGLKNLPDGGILALPNYPLKQAIGAIEVRKNWG
jgi:hypothetical protein